MLFEGCRCFFVFFLLFFHVFFFWGGVKGKIPFFVVPVLRHAHIPGAILERHPRNPPLKRRTEKKTHPFESKYPETRESDTGSQPNTHQNGGGASCCIRSKLSEPQGAE